MLYKTNNYYALLMKEGMAHDSVLEKTDKNSGPKSAQKRRQNAKPAVPRTAQQSIPMQRMFEDGTCRVRPGYYTRTIQYQDINYQLAQQEDKTAIFEEWCSFLNFFDSSIKFELSFVNMATDSTEFEKSIRIPFQKDGFDDVRAEYSQMLRQQLAKGNNGLTKTKFITFGVEGESMAQVKPRLDHIQNDLLNNFHRLGVQAKPLNGVQRLKLMHDMFNMDGSSKFHFDWKDLVKSGLSVKDAIAPTAFAFKNSRAFQMGSIYCAASFLSITASDISDQLLKDFLDMLNQANGDRQILAKQLNISPHQLSYVTHSGEGEGLLFFGNVILPFVDHFPKDLELYRILTTKLNEISESAQK